MTQLHKNTHYLSYYFLATSTIRLIILKQPRISVDEHLCFSRKEKSIK